MKKNIFIIVLCIIIILVICFYIYKKTPKNNIENYSSNYTAERTSTNQNIENNIAEEIPKEDTEDEVLSEFSTRLPKDTKARYSNIELACDTLNDTIVKSGDTFSLWDVLGCPTKERGYKKAKAFTSDGKIKKSYGGGICQVSTTIYNAVLGLDDIEIIERHEHSRDVVYIKDGKDAAVSYKSADLKFKNLADYDIKLKAEVEKNKIVIKIEKV